MCAITWIVTLPSPAILTKTRILAQQSRKGFKTKTARRHFVRMSSTDVNEVDIGDVWESTCLKNTNDTVGVVKCWQNCFLARCLKVEFPSPACNTLSQSAKERQMQIAEEYSPLHSCNESTNVSTVDGWFKTLSEKHNGKKVEWEGTRVKKFSQSYSREELVSCMNEVTQLFSYYTEHILRYSARNYDVIAKMIDT